MRALVTIAIASIMLAACLLAVALATAPRPPQDRYAVNDSPECLVKYFWDTLVSQASD